jgi:hypothetical protein
VSEAGENGQCDREIRNLKINQSQELRFKRKSLEWQNLDKSFSFLPLHSPEVTSSAER